MSSVAFLISAWLFMLGAIFGSFINVVIYRSLAEETRKKGEKWYKGRSRCDTCHKVISWYDNIPLFSFLLLRGKCRHCQTAIGLNHPVLELMAGSLFVWWYWAGTMFFNLTTSPFAAIQPLFWLIVGLILLYIFFTDLEYYIIPNTAVLVLTVITLLYRLALTGAGIMRSEDLVLAGLSVLGAVAFLGGIWLLSKGRGIGFGDVKLMVPLGLLLGWPNTFVMLFVAFVTGGLVGIGLLLGKKKSWGQVVPFGPFLVVATCISLLWGQELFRWYMSWLGL